MSHFLNILSFINCNPDCSAAAAAAAELRVRDFWTLSCTRRQREGTRREEGEKRGRTGVQRESEREREREREKRESRWMGRETQKGQSSQ